MEVRVDKFIWAVRLAKTRSLASKLVDKHKVKVNGEEIKPSKKIKVGDIIAVIKHTACFQYKVLALLDKRVGAKLVEGYVKDITDPIEVEKYKTYVMQQRVYRKHNEGKPTKRDRRKLNDFFDDFDVEL